jgi:hypothetical protein
VSDMTERTGGVHGTARRSSGPISGMVWVRRKLGGRSGLRSIRLKSMSRGVVTALLLAGGLAVLAGVYRLVTGHDGRSQVTADATLGEAEELRATGAALATPAMAAGGSPPRANTTPAPQAWPRAPSAEPARRAPAPEEPELMTQLRALGDANPLVMLELAYAFA